MIERTARGSGSICRKRLLGWVVLLLLATPLPASCGRGTAAPVGPPPPASAELSYYGQSLADLLVAEDIECEQLEAIPSSPPKEAWYDGLQCGTVNREGSPTLFAIHTFSDAEQESTTVAYQREFGESIYRGIYFTAGRGIYVYGPDRDPVADIAGKLGLPVERFGPPAG